MLSSGASNIDFLSLTTSISFFLSVIVFSNIPLNDKDLYASHLVSALLGSGKPQFDHLFISSETFISFFPFLYVSTINKQLPLRALDAVLLYLT